MNPHDALTGSHRAITHSKEAITMLIPEELARSRKHDLLREARQARMIRACTAGRWWRKLARFAQKRADRARQRAAWP